LKGRVQFSYQALLLYRQVNKSCVYIFCRQFAGCYDTHIVDRVVKNHHGDQSRSSKVHGSSFWCDDRSGYLRCTVVSQMVNHLKDLKVNKCVSL